MKNTLKKNTTSLLTNNHFLLIKLQHLRSIIISAMIIFMNSYTACADDSKFSLGISISQDSIDDLPSSLIDNGLKLDFGYTLDKVFSLELSYYKVGDVNSPKPVIPSGDIFTATTKTDVLDLSVLANHQWDRFSIYAKLGVFYSDLTTKIYMSTNNNIVSKSSSSGSNLSFGIGAGYKINNNFKFVLDYTDSDLSDQTNTSIAITSLGLKYTF